MQAALGGPLGRPRQQRCWQNLIHVQIWIWPSAQSLRHLEDWHAVRPRGGGLGRPGQQRCCQHPIPMQIVRTMGEGGLGQL